MTFIDFVALVFAVGAPINAWKHTLFDSWREGLVTWGANLQDEALPEDLRPAVSWADRFRYFIGQLADCRFCLHYHAAFWLIVLYGISLWVPATWCLTIKLPIYWLAAVRLSYWGALFFEEDHGEYTAQTTEDTYARQPR